MKRSFVIWLSVIALLSGCSTRPTVSLPEPPGKDVIRPIIAIGSFENRSSYEGRWALGPGMTDLLLAEVIASKHFVVVERQRLETLIAELENQQSRLFRPEGRKEFGRLKNAAFYVRGVITDFTHIANHHLYGGGKDLFGRKTGHTARVALVLTIVEVESGQVIDSVNVDGLAETGSVRVDLQYKGVRFGGDAFYRTPLGIATRDAIRRGLRKVVKTVPKERWQPRIAHVDGERIIITGGRFQDQHIGAMYDVLGPDQKIKDPVTGDVIDTLPGENVGRLVVESVREQTAIAKAISGEGFVRGQQLVPVATR